jgi:ribosomal protein S12 methylthiotransferase
MTTNELKNKKVGFVSLGCDKNRVDLEKMIFNLSNFGMKLVNDPSIADIIIVNTCAFLESARAEAIENILDMAEFKHSTNLEKLIVTGCLNELNYPDLAESLPEVDLFVNIKDNDNIVQHIAKLYNLDLEYRCIDDRIITNEPHYSYLKIAEGCNNFCTYCLIPYIRGRFRSEPIEKLVNEAKNLAKKGVKELILVAQDVTKYGIDIYGKKSLVPLIRELSKIDEIKWIRLLYCYPEEIDDELIHEIRDNDKVLKYLDIPLQHVSTSILKSMNRRSNYDSIIQLFDKLYKEIPSIAIRTTFIIGFPGETEKDVDLIAEFLNKYKLVNVGFFAYSREEGTKAYNLDNQIDENTKLERVDKLAQIQYDIVQFNNNSYIGTETEVIVDSVQDGYSICRNFRQTANIDTVIYVNEELNEGQFYNIKITNKLDYDLEGEKL